MISLDNYKKKQLVFLFTNEGEKLSFKNDNIIVKDKDDKLKHQSTCWRIAALFIIGGITLTSGLIERSHKFCFPVFLMRSSFKTYDVIGFKAQGNTLLKRKQYLYSGLDIAQHLIINKIDNQKITLNKLRFKDIETSIAISDLNRYKKRVYDTKSIQEIMGLEGSASRTYFANYFTNCKWIGRQPRIKKDFVNSTLDIGYTLLFNYIESLLYYFGFDVYMGVLHREFYKRKSLVCDLVEPFRPLIDNCIRNAISLGQCREDDFVCNNSSFKLKWENNKKYILFLIKPILKNKELMFCYIRDYYRAFSRSLDIDMFPLFKI